MPTQHSQKKSREVKSNECVYRVTDSLFNSCNDAAASFLPWVEAGDLDTFCQLHSKVLCATRMKQATWSKMKNNSFPLWWNVIIHEEY